MGAVKSLRQRGVRDFVVAERAVLDAHIGYVDPPGAGVPAKGGRTVRDLRGGPAKVGRIVTDLRSVHWNERTFAAVIPDCKIRLADDDRPDGRLTAQEI